MSAKRVDWPAAAAALLVLGVVTGSPALRLGATLVLATGGLSWFWARFALQRLSYQRVLGHSHVYAGEETTLTIRLKNDKPLPLLWTRADDHVPDGIGVRMLRIGTGEGDSEPGTASLAAVLSDDDVAGPGSAPQTRRLRHTAYLGAYGEVTWRYRLECPARGWYAFGACRVETGDPFGLYEVGAERGGKTWLIVYPAVRPLPALGFPPTDPFGGRRSHRPLVVDPLQLAGVRDYRPEDSRRLVHWKASARRGDLQVKQLEPVATATTMLVVDMATMNPPWLGSLPELQEQVVAVAASIAQRAQDAGESIGVAINGAVPGTGQPIRVGPARGEPQLRHVLKALAAVSDFVHPLLPQLVAAESRRAPWGATLVVVTAIETALLREQLQRLRRAGRRVVLVSLDDSATAEGSALAGITTYRLPPAQVAAALYGRR